MPSPNGSNLAWRSSRELEKLNELDKAVAPHAFSIFEQYQCRVSLDPLIGYAQHDSFAIRRIGLLLFRFKPNHLQADLRDLSC